MPIALPKQTMNAQEFDFLWKRNFPKSSPLPHLFRQDYSSDWIRIKSLPGTKRYPTNDKDIETLLERQNAVITEVLGNNTRVFGITGEYDFDRDQTLPRYLKTQPFQKFTFVPIHPINMYEISRSEFKQGDLYQPYLTELVWTNGAFNDLLEAIAYDEARMFFMSVERKCLVAPYDGGIDLIISDREQYLFLADKFKEWMAPSISQKV